MATVGLNTVAHKESMMPPELVEALGYMQRSIACPEDVKGRIAALRVPADDVTGTRMNTSWRTGPSSSGPSSSGSGSGSRYGNRGGWDAGNRPRYGDRSGGGGDRSGGDRSSNDRSGGDRSGGDRGDRSNRGFTSSNSSSSSNSAAANQRPQVIHNSSGGRRPYIDRALAPRFGNKARKDVTTEERMIDRIRDKMNKFSPWTYDATKVWLCELLKADNTDFLSDFIKLVFEKAAKEELHCATYAKLLTELCAGYPHVVTELQRIFAEFMDIFAEAASEPAVGSVEYDAYLTLRDRRKVRRGYASFIGLIANDGVLTAENITQTCKVILDGVAASKAVEGQGPLCEEYVDCLADLMKCCKALLKSTVAPALERITALKEKGGSLTNKARFKLLDTLDLFL